MSTWQFDSSVAENFVEHARCHIPNYDAVINKCIEASDQYLNKTSSIIDVGCATGETLRRLYHAGYRNLTGVESSSHMIQHCDPTLAKLIVSDTFPQQMFDAILCNWTLHFVKNKTEYLANMYQGLNPCGFLILSEKTSLETDSIQLYHNWKHTQGVSWDYIKHKEAAIKDIMYVDQPDWYSKMLVKLGFKNVQIIDASWCFTTWIAFKK
jgi:tRNA (cmo5U34)-methyltransferase